MVVCFDQAPAALTEQGKSRRKAAPSAASTATAGPVRKLAKPAKAPVAKTVALSAAKRPKREPAMTLVEETLEVLEEDSHAMSGWILSDMFTSNDFEPSELLESLDSTSTTPFDTHSELSPLSIAEIELDAEFAPVHMDDSTLALLGSFEDESCASSAMFMPTLEPVPAPAPMPAAIPSLPTLSALGPFDAFAELDDIGDLGEGFDEFDFDPSMNSGRSGSNSRDNHNALERVRRVQIRQSYHNLKMQIPGLRDRKAYSLTILQEAAVLIEALKRQEIDVLNEISRLRKANETLAAAQSSRRAEFESATCAPVDEV